MTSLALKIEAAAIKRRNGPHARPDYLKVVHPVVPEPVVAVPAPDYEPGLFVRVGDAVIRQLGFTMIVAAIVGMTVIGYWTGFNERVVLDTIAKVETLMAEGLPAAQVPADWDRVTGRRAR